MKPEYLKLMKMLDVGKDGLVHEKTLGLAIPEGALLPCPVIFIAHYGIDAKTVGKHEGLAHGFAVAGNLENVPADNAILFDDDLYFNSACIDALHTRPEIDPAKVVVMGGSAGGYQTLMLTALHLGIAASVECHHRS